MGESLLAVTAKVMPSGKLSVTPASETVGAALAEGGAGKTVLADIMMTKARSRAEEKEKWEMRNAKVDAGRGGSLITKGGFLVGAQQRVKISVEDQFGVARLEAGAVVLHHLIRVQDVGADLVAPFGGDVLAFEARLLLCLALQLLLQQARLQDLERGLFVTALRALVLAGFFVAGRSRHTGCYRDWSSDVCLPI